jgi:hypothetical protein
MSHTLVRTALLGLSVFAGGMTLAQNCESANPCSTTSTVPNVLVGTLSGQPVQGKTFNVVVRDKYNDPIAHAEVDIEFEGTGIRLVKVPPYRPGTYVGCSPLMVSYIATGVDGVASFAVSMSGFNNNPVVKVYASGGYGTGNRVLLKTIRVRSTDIVQKLPQTFPATEQTSLSDLSAFSADYLSNPTASETDFDLNGTTGLGDFAIFSSEYNGATWEMCQ